MSYNNQGVISIENQENCDNKVISSQSSGKSSSSKRNSKSNIIKKIESSDKQSNTAPSSAQSSASTQSGRKDISDASLTIHAVEYGLEDLQVRVEETLKFVLNKDFGKDTTAEYILFEKEQEIKELEMRVAELKKEISKK